jgi:hypothetical protein
MKKTKSKKSEQVKLMNGCTHSHSAHLADESSASSGTIYWCPECGAIKVSSQWNFPLNDEWRNPKI